MEESSSSSPFPTKDGLHLSYLDIFIQECGGEKVIEEMSTFIIYQSFIVPKTMTKQCAYLDLLINDTQEEFIGRPNRFIIHAWQSNFLHLVQTLKSCFTNSSEEIVVWIDIFCFNQYLPFHFDFTRWVPSFLEKIKSIHSSVLVLSSWKEAIPFGRLWCLFEIYCTHATDSTFQIAFLPEEKKEFFQELQKSKGYYSFTKILSLINIMKGKTSKYEDSRAILHYLAHAVGFDQFNRLVITKIRQWIKSTAEDCITSTDVEHLTTTDRAIYQAVIAAALQHEGLFHEAEEFYQESYSLKVQLYGKQHLETIDLLSEISWIKLKTGRYSSALSLAQEAYHLSFQTFGEYHENTLYLLNMLGVCYSFLGNLVMAQEIFIQCWDGGKRYLGEQHRYNIGFVHNLASNFLKLGKCEESIPLFQFSWQLSQLLNGKDHPETLDQVSGLAAVYIEQRKYSLAEPLLQDCLEKRKLICGEYHMDTLQSINDLAWLKKRQGQYLQAEILWQECIEKRLLILGEKHPETIRSIRVLGRLYTEQHQYCEARTLFQEAYERRKVTLGVQHPLTIEAVEQIAQVYQMMKQYEEAEKFFIQSYELKRESFGSYHMESLLSLLKLADFYKTNQEYEAAESILTICLQRKQHYLEEDTLVDTSTIRILLAEVYLAQQKYDLAVELYREEIEYLQQQQQQYPRYSSTMDPLKPSIRYNEEILTKMFQLATIYILQEKWKEANTMLEECLENSRRGLGKDHTLSMMVLKKLEEVKEHDPDGKGQCIVS